MIGIEPLVSWLVDFCDSLCSLFSPDCPVDEPLMIRGMDPLVS